MENPKVDPADVQADQRRKTVIGPGYNRGMRILTWNTWKNTPPYSARLAAMTRAAEAARPDILLLQEAFVGAGADTARHLARALGLHCVAAPSRAKRRVHEGAMVASTNGLAILSRQAAASSRIIALPGHPDDPDRIAQVARIGALTVVNLHLTHLVSGGDALRRGQARHLLDRLEADTPTLLGGDLNAEAVDPAVSALRQAGFRDLAEARPDPTIDGRRIDFLMTRAMTLSSVETVLVGADPVDGVAPSDHAGVLAELEVAAH